MNRRRSSSSSRHSAGNCPTIVLASRSARRADLLAQAGIDFEIHPSCVDETRWAAAGLSAQELAVRLALAKARDVAARFPCRLVLGADTLVEADGMVIGKAKDAKDAKRILTVLFAKPHKVITAVALIRGHPALEMADVAVTTVYPRQVTQDQLCAYVASGAWEGKAGAYGIQDHPEPFVERIEGSFTNVVGLPMELVLKMLRQAGHHPK